jgi:hypothetical protein
MEHRHLDSKQWSAATVDSVLERGDLRDWRELFAAVRTNRALADLVLRVASQHDLGGASVLAKALVKRLSPDASCMADAKGADAGAPRS